MLFRVAEESDNGPPSKIGGVPDTGTLQPYFPPVNMEISILKKFTRKSRNPIPLGSTLFVGLLRT